MLITQSTAEAWFRKDSFIYQNYIYLFRNPLWWAKAEPKGASLCPYFWMAMFSFFIFKPVTFLLVGIGRILKPLFAFGGRPISALDLKLRSLITDDPYTRPPGYGIMAALIIGTLLTVSVAAFGFVGANAFRWYTSLELPVYRFVTWGIATGIATLLGVVIHITKNKYQRNRCRSEIYIYLWALAVNVAAFVWFKEEYIQAWGILGSIVLGAIINLFKGIWVGLKYVAIGIKYAVIYTAAFVWAMLTAGMDTFFVPAWLFTLLVLGFLGAIAHFADKLMHTKGGEVSYEKVWSTIIARAFGKKVYEAVKWTLNNRITYKDSHRHKMTSGVIEQLAVHYTDAFLTTTYAEFISAMRKRNVPLQLWALIKTGTVSQAVALRNAGHITLHADFPIAPVDEYDVYDYIKGQSTTKEFLTLIDEMAVKDVEAQNRQRIRRELRHNSWSARMCRAFTNKAWSAIETAKKHSAVGFDYAIRVIKARKQGACPYIRFTDAVDEAPGKQAEARQE